MRAPSKESAYQNDDHDDDRDDREEEEVESCPCGYYCMDCLGLTWRDFF